MTNFESFEMQSNDLVSFQLLENVENHNVITDDDPGVSQTHPNRVPLREICDVNSDNHILSNDVAQSKDSEENSKMHTKNAAPISDTLKEIYRKRKMDSTDGIEVSMNYDSKKLKNEPEHHIEMTEEKRVLINVNHPDGDPDVYLNDEISLIVKPHQVSGIRFMFQKVIGSNFKKSANIGSSCILAHAMGLGKTLQTIAFCDLLFRYTNCTKVICIAPVSVILNWKAEFDRYLPAKSKYPRTFNIYQATEKEKTRNANILSWSKKGGVLLIGYEILRKELNDNNEKGTISSRLLTAELVIADEGHRLKNYKAEVVSSVMKLTHSRKIILTGYPLQNNLLEYWCMINIIKPNFLGTILQFTELFKSPIEKGQYIDSTTEERKTMNYRSFVLHSLLSDFVQREEHILQQLLPLKHDFVLFLKMTPLQERLHKTYSSFAINVISSFAMVQKIVNHPDIVYNFLIHPSLESLEIDNSEAPVTKDAEDIDTEKEITSKSEKPESEFKNLALELMSNYKTDIIENSAKMQVVFEILKECNHLGDRVVLFSQSLTSLNLIECFLQSELQWKHKWNYFRLDGTTSMNERHQMISEFQLNPSITLFLMSTKAGSLGINLTGANRVILFDISWNPCFDMQAVARVHRIGQTKPCFIYRLVMDSCLEKTVYDHQINKQAMSARIVDQLTSTGNLSVASKSVCHNNDNVKGIEDNIGDDPYSHTDIVLENLVTNFPQIFSKSPKKHVVLTTQETLTEEEKSQARNEFSSAAYEIDFQIPRTFDNPTSETAALQDSDTWIPEQQWQQKGMRTKVLHLQQDFIIPPDVHLKNGQKIMVIDSPTGQYIQLENKKLISLKSTEIFKF